PTELELPAEYFTAKAGSPNFVRVEAHTYNGEVGTATRAVFHGAFGIEVDQDIEGKTFPSNVQITGRLVGDISYPALSIFVDEAEYIADFFQLSESGEFTFTIPAALLL
ncbi:MAG: hypothetical protein ACKO96_23875, partial [Flammeovirgaceae bacterium]